MILLLGLHRTVVAPSVEDEKEAPPLKRQKVQDHDRESIGDLSPIHQGSRQEEFNAEERMAHAQLALEVGSDVGIVYNDTNAWVCTCAFVCGELVQCDNC